jgi:cell division protein FtsQ
VTERAELARAEEEFARRQRAVRRRTRRRWLVVSAVLAFVLIVGWTVLFSSWFAVSGVRVVGAEAVPADRVTGVAAVPLGGSLARLDVDAVARRVETIPAIADASVSRSWPDRVVIRVTERVPVVAIEAGGGGFELVDGDGVVFRTVPQRPPGLPIATVTGPRREKTLESVVTVAEALPGDLLRRVRTIAAPSQDSIRLRLDRDVEVVWGSAEDSARKVRVLTVLMRRSARIYDVSAPDLPTTQGEPR